MAGLLLAWLPAAHAVSAVTQWNAAALQEIRLGRLGPPVVARALAVAHTCMYDAWAAYDAKALPSIATTGRRPSPERTLANKQKAVSFAAYRCLVNLFPAGTARLQSTMTGLGYDPADTSLNLTTPQGIGNAAADAVIAARRFDNSNQYGDLAAGAYADFTRYAPVNLAALFCNPLTLGACTPNAADIGRWQPLTGDTGTVQRFIAPHWFLVRPFALSAATDFDKWPEVAAGPNYRQSPQRYQADVDEMVQISGQLTPQQKLIVEYWADGPASELPPGHWALYAQHVSRRDALDIDQDAKLFFAMHNASLDAGIVAWYYKRLWDGVRPITAVRALKQGQQIFAWGGPGRSNQHVDGGKWSPYNPGSNLSPGFPGWVSGHSTFSSASAAVLRNFTGSDRLDYTVTLPANYGRVEPGVPAVPTSLSYRNISDAVNDAGLSRLYAGIHFPDDNAVGLAVGHQIGQRAWNKAVTLFEGGVAPLVAQPPSTTPAPGSAWCAGEHQTCTVPAGSTATIWYGWGDRWVARSNMAGIAFCKNDVYGDPVPGTVKACHMKIDGSSASQQPPAASTDCAAEGATCVLPERTLATVWFGTGSTWVQRTGMVGTVSCIAHTFGANPVPGVAERCRYAVEQSTYPLPPIQGAVHCASEGGTCALPPGRKATVWYGANKQWARLNGQQTATFCSFKMFGDPLRGVAKSCAYALE